MNIGTTRLQLEAGALTHEWRENPEGWLGEQYERFNQHVIDHVPSEQLLIFNVKEGSWRKPLCNFLQCNNVPPHQDFPHSKVNDAKSLKRMKKMFLVAVYGWIPTVVVTTAGALMVERHVTLSSRAAGK